MNLLSFEDMMEQRTIFVFLTSLEEHISFNVNKIMKWKVLLMR